MARQVLWKVRNTTARDALVVAEPEVGNYALVYADGLLYKAAKAGTGSGVWEGSEAINVASVEASGDILSTAGDLVALTGDIVAEDGNIFSTLGYLWAALDVVTPKLNGLPVNTAVLPLLDGASIATVATANNHFSVTLAGNRTLANPTGLVTGGVYRWYITQDGVGSKTLDYGNLFRFPGGKAVGGVLTTTAGAVDVLTAFYNGTTLTALLSKNLIV